jgi:DNA primase
MNTDRILEEIRSKVDIVDFISDYVQLKKSGQNYKGLCPFHSEKTPSFMVSQSKQIFHCFGCGVGGDVVSFLMKHDNLSFNEAKRYIAKKAGIKITDFNLNKRVSEKREKLLYIQSEALKFFAENLKSSDPAQAYLEKRGVDEVSINNFHIGYATGERDALFKYLKTKGYSDSLIKNAGLIIFDGKDHRDTFRGRIIFPIFSYQNDVIAFGGRVMDNSMPKYLNSPETEIFKKGDTLFAINLAKDEIRKKGYAIIVEGYLDAIICHQYGFKNTVAPLGTALTLRHLQRLKFLTGKVVLVFDSDEAGISAARRSLAILCECDFRARILLLPEGEDPDSFLRKSGSQPFKKLLSHTMSMIEFILNTAKGDKIETVKEALGTIALMRDLIMAGEMLRELAEKSRSNESDLRGELKKLKTGRPQSFEELRPVRATKNEEYLLLSAIITFPEKADNVLSRLNTEDLKEKTVKSLFEKIRALSNNLNMGSLLSEADDEEKALIRELSFEPGFDLEHVDRNIDDCLQTMVQKRFEERKRLADAKESDDVALHDSFLKEKRRLIKGVKM